MESRRVWRGAFALGIAGAFGVAAVAVSAGNAPPSSPPTAAPAEALPHPPSPGDVAAAAPATPDTPQTTPETTASAAPAAPAPAGAATAPPAPSARLTTTDGGAVLPTAASLGAPTVALPMRTVSPTPPPPTPHAAPSRTPTTAPTTTSTTSAPRSTTTSSGQRRPAGGLEPEVSIGNAPWQLYGGTLKFPVTLSAPAAGGGSVDWETTGGTAIPGTEYDVDYGTVTFNPGDTTAEISVYTHGQYLWSQDHTVEVTLSNAAGLQISTATGSGTLASNGLIPVTTAADEVDTNPGDGVCLTVSNLCSLRAAVQELNTWTTVNPDAVAHIQLFPSTTYALTIPGADEDLSATGDLDFTNTAPNITFLIDIRIGITDPIIDGTGLDRVLDVHGARLRLNRVSVVNGVTANVADTSQDSGGGIRALGTGSEVTLDVRSRVANNQARYGGGIYAEGTLTLNWAEVNSNTAFQTGGGVLSTGSLVLAPTVYATPPSFDGNQAGDCAAGYAALGSLSSTGATVTNNTATGCAGGALVGQGATATVTGGQIASNTAGSWAGGILVQGDSTIDGTAITGNTALYGAGLTQTQSTLTLKGTTVDGNHATGSGSAAGGLLLCDGAGGASTSVDDATVVQNNTAESAGGVLLNDTDTGFSGKVLNNTATAFGGGVLNISDIQQPVLDQSVISGNSAAIGGGLYQLDASPGLTVANTTIAGNSASITGSGMAAAGPVTVDRSTISTNTGGGAAIVAGAWVALTNSTVGDNAVPGISVLGSPAGLVSLDSSTVSGNDGGGIINAAGPGGARMENSIVASQASGTDCTGAMTSWGHNIDSDDTCSLNIYVFDLPATDPELGPLADNGGYTKTFAIGVTSPAFDSGIPIEYPSTDQRGVSRPQGGAVDRGAFELVV